MIHLEQAIFTSAQTSRSTGYQLVAHSPGIGESDLRELSVWGPSHDSLWESDPTALSVNFHSLPSGAFCISQTLPAGEEFSQRRGPQLYTQQLVVTPAGLATFANNPFALLQAAIAQGHVQILARIPRQLEPFLLDSDARAATAESLVQLAGAAEVSEVLQVALHAKSLGLIAGERGPRLIAALFNALPVECRTAFSFTTGLRFSPRRPFRLICLPDNRVENQRFARQYEITLLELAAKRKPEDNAPKEERKPLACATHETGWAAFVSAALASRKTTLLAEELNRPHPGLSLESVDRLGEQLLALVGDPATIVSEPMFEAAEVVKCFAEPVRTAPQENKLKIEPEWSPPSDVETHEEVVVVDGEPDAPPRLSQGEDPAEFEPLELPYFAPATLGDVWQRAEEQHARGMQATSVIADAYCREVEMLRDTLHIGEEPAQTLGERCPAALEILQQLEDVIFEAMAGKAEVLEQLRSLWRHVLDLMGRPLAEAAREQYLCYALAVWRQFSGGDDMGDPYRAANAMEVICLLFDR